MVSPFRAYPKAPGDVDSRLTCTSNDPVEAVGSVQVRAYRGSSRGISPASGGGGGARGAIGGRTGRDPIDRRADKGVYGGFMGRLLLRCCIGGYSSGSNKISSKERDSDHSRI
jgi:hypothetical protein